MDTQGVPSESQLSTHLGVLSAIVEQPVAKKPLIGRRKAAATRKRD